MIPIQFYTIFGSLIIPPLALATSNANGMHNFAPIGMCESASGDRRCALQPSDCEPSHIDGQKNVNGEKWHSAYRMTQLGYPPCTCEETRVSACFIGEAGLDSTGANVHFRCAPHPESCVLSKGETFGLINGIVPLEDEALCGCSVLGALEEHWFKAEHDNAYYPTPKRTSPPVAQSATLYGACYKSLEDNFCAFSPSDCQGAEEGYSWVDPVGVFDFLGHDCTCADAHVGGCVGGFMGFTCAVTSADCTWDEYLPPKKLKEQHGYDCRLCKPIEHYIVHDDVIDSLAVTEDAGIMNKLILAGGLGLVLGLGLAILALGGFFLMNRRLKRMKAVQRREHNRVFEGHNSNEDVTVSEDDSIQSTLEEELESAQNDLNCL